MSMMQMVRLVKAIGKRSASQAEPGVNYASTPHVPIHYPISTSARGKIVSILASRTAEGNPHA